MIEPTGESEQQQALEPVEQETIEFHGQQIIAVKLADSRICVVLRWICVSLNIDPQAQVRRVQRTPSIVGELLRVKVQTGGGRQTMPALTLRDFPTWVLGINPNEVKEDPQDPEKAERIRQMIIAYQVEAVDVLYRHFAQKAQARQVRKLPGTYTTIVPAGPLAEPVKPAEEATDEEKATYYEHLSAWALWVAVQYNQQWRNEMQSRIEDQEARLEAKEAALDLIPEILDRLGSEKISVTHRGQIKGYVNRLHEVSGKPYPTIYNDIRLAFGPASYQDLLEAEWSQIEAWFLTQIEKAKKK